MTLQDALQWTITLALGVWVGVLSWRSPRAELRRTKAKWLELELEVTGVLEKLGTWAARQAKRESREARRALEAERVADARQPDQLELEVPTGTRHPKADLWDRARGNPTVAIPGGSARNADPTRSGLHGSLESSGPGGNGGADSS